MAYDIQNTTGSESVGFTEVARVLYVLNRERFILRLCK